MTMDTEEKKEEINPEEPAPAPAMEQKELPPEEMSFWQAAAGVFMEPSKAFPFLATKKAWIAFPLILLLVTTFVSTYVFFERVDREAFIMQQLRNNKFASQMPQDQYEKVVNDFKEKNSLTSSIWPGFFMMVWLLLAAVVYYFCFLALGGTGGFMPTLIVVCWAELTTCAAQLISIPIMLAKAGDQLLHPEAILLSNLGALVGPEKISPAIFSLLSAFDVFAAWNLILLIIGLAAVSKLSKGMSAMIILSLYALKIALKVAWVAFFVQ